MLNKKITQLGMLFTMIVAFVAGVHFSYAQGSSVKVLGYAWSANVGWISMNCQDGGASQANICGVSNYGVTLDTATNTFQGFGWSDNVGWVKFGGLSGMPISGTNATYNPATGAISGFARFCGGRYGYSSWPTNQWLPNNTCAGSDRADGWDGWLSLSGASPAYGVVVGSSGIFSGYAWGSDVVGWVNFSTVKLETLTTGSIVFQIGAKPTSQPVVNYVPAVYPSAAVYPTPTITAPVGDQLFYKWTTSGAQSCNLSGTVTTASNTTVSYTPITSANILTGSQAAVVPLDKVGIYYIALTCIMTDGTTKISSGTVKVTGEFVEVKVDPTTPLSYFSLTLAYRSVNTLPNSCKLYSHKPNNTAPQPSVSPGVTPEPSISSLIPPYPSSVQNPQWNQTTPVSYIANQASGKITITPRPTTSTRFYIECQSALGGGQFLHAGVDQGPVEVIPMLLEVRQSGTQVTSVPQGSKVDLFYDAISSGPMNSCVGKANDFTGGVLGAQFATTGWSLATGLYGLTPSSTPGQVNSVPTILTSGKTIQYYVQCIAASGALAVGTANLDITAGGSGLVLTATPNTFIENTSGLTTKLSWSHPNPSAFPVNSCVPGDNTLGSTGIKINGSWKTATNWTGLTALSSPNASQSSVQVIPSPAGTTAEYSITCKDSSGVNQVARTNVTYYTPVGNSPQVNIEFLGCLPDDVSPTNVSIGWTSANVDRCYIPSGAPVWSPMFNLWIANGMLSNTLAGQWDSWSYLALPFTFQIECEASDGTIVRDAVTVDPSCTATDAGPKKPRFEEF